MPIFLDNLDTVQTMVKTHTPKFFHQKLTGSGGQRGLLNQNLNPCNAPRGVKVTSEYTGSRKQTYTNNDITTIFIPVGLLSKDAWTLMDELDRTDDAVQIAQYVGQKPITAWIHMEPASIMLEEKQLSASQMAPGVGGGVMKKTTPCYHLFLFTSNCANKTHVQKPYYLAGIKAASGMGTADFSEYQHFYTCDPVADLDLVKQALDAAGYLIDKQALADYIQNYSLYTGLCRMSEQWQDRPDVLLHQVFVNNKKHHNSSTGNGAVASILRHLENYAIPLDCYRQIYQDIQAMYTHDEVQKLCKMNLNLLLSNTLESLKQNKASLNRMAIGPSGPVVPQGAKMLSAEQLRAVSSTEPLVLVQSGAGTGKAQPLDEKILTPDGWKTMADMYPGCQVIGSDGLPHRVLRVHERGMRHCYGLTFTDGARTRCCNEHLWTVIDRRNKNPTKTLTTDKWLDSCEMKKMYLPQVSPVAFHTRNQPVDPYLFGALIAGLDQHRNRPALRIREDAVRDQMARRVVSHGWTMVPTGTAGLYAIKSKGKLDTLLGNMCIRADEPCPGVPDAYLLGDISQRTAFVNGVFDTQGTVDVRTGRPHFRTLDKALADGVLQMLWSLGVSAKISVRKNVLSTRYTVIVQSDYNPFLMSPVAQGIKPLQHVGRRGIKSMQDLGMVPMRCIEVDAPDQLYVTSDFILTHNSTVILNRIQYMVSNGVNPDDITVLSFTNAAADHITEKNPNVHSMTIAKMIHSIYSLNYPQHELSSLDTIINTLDIYYPNDPDAAMFKRKCYDILKNEPDAFTGMNNFVEYHFDKVMQMLDQIGQTSLELEIIICYQQIAVLQEPPEIQSKHLIIDEVQDNSIFEFIYALKYVEKHSESLFIVGDCSQTLYEFRASNPRALNVLESSGVFTAHQLQVNYRSNQEILDFANILLNNIEANQYAHIQLRANSLRPVTEQSFTDAVQVHYHQLSHIKDFKDYLPTIIGNDLRGYIQDKMAKHETIAFLAHKRREIAMVEEQLRQSYPNATIATLIPDKQHNDTIFSRFIQKYWTQVKFAPATNLVGIISRLILDNITDIAGYKGKNPNVTMAIQSKAMNLIGKWAAQYTGAINNWVYQASIGQMTMDEVLDDVKQSLLRTEIQNNAARQAVLGQRNRQRKEDQANAAADFTLSTIHSAKGLEFDHVAIVMQNENSMAEDKKRMFYVALTRAMQTEVVVAYDTVKKPKILTDYETIVRQLHNIHPRPAVPTGPKAANPKAVGAASAMFADAACIVDATVMAVPALTVLPTPAGVTLADFGTAKPDASVETTDDGTKADESTGGDAVVA